MCEHCGVQGHECNVTSLGDRESGLNRVMDILRVVTKFRQRGTSTWVELHLDGSGAMVGLIGGKAHSFFEWSTDFNGIEKAFAEWLLEEYK